jgi:hypothetical protein
MAEPEAIVEEIKAFLTKKKSPAPSKAKKS